MAQLRPAAELHAIASALRFDSLLDKINTAASVGKFAVDIKFSDIHRDEIELLQENGYKLTNHHVDDEHTFEICW